VESTGQHTVANIANSHRMKVSRVLSLTAQKQGKYDAVMADFIGSINWSAKPLPKGSVIWFPANTLPPACLCAHAESASVDDQR